MNEIEEIKMIENRSKEQVEMVLHLHQLGNRKYKVGDYSEAKRAVFRGQFIDCNIYDKQIGWICDYLGI